MTSFDDVLGTASLPPPPAFSVQNLVAPASAPGDAGSAVAPMASPATAANGGFGALNLAQLDGTAPQGGIFGPDTGRFMSSLGAGLSSAGQNWNKPAAAAFASGAGAALQGGQQWQNQLQDAKLKAIHAALAAWKIGDMAAFRQQTTNLRVLAAAQQGQPPGAAGGAPTNNPPAPPASVTGSPSGPTVYGNQAPPVAAPLPATVGTTAPRLTAQDALAQARNAIARGAPRDAVMQRLREHDFDPSGL